SPALQGKVLKYADRTLLPGACAGRRVVGLGQLDLVLAPVLEDADRFIQLDVRLRFCRFILLDRTRYSGIRLAGTALAGGRGAMGRMLLVVFEMVKQVTFTNFVIFTRLRCWQFQCGQRRLGWFDYHVWRYADGLNRAAVGSEVARGGEPQGRLVIER